VDQLPRRSIRTGKIPILATVITGEIVTTAIVMIGIVGTIAMDEEDTITPTKSLASKAIAMV